MLNDSGPEVMTSDKVSDSPPQHRMPELDSLRGIAALLVFFSHFAGLFPGMESYNRFARILWDGAAAVDLFFVLSGFVLFVAAERGKNTIFGIDYAVFQAKRIFRLYPAFWAALLVALLCKYLAGDLHSAIHLSSWAKSTWSDPLTLDQIIRHVLMISPGLNSHLLDPPIWSLVLEMKISLVLPLIFIGLRKYPAAYSFALLAIILAASIIYPARVPGFVMYIPEFFLGAYLAKNRIYLLELCSARSPSQKFIILLSGVLLYGNRFGLGGWALGDLTAAYISAIGSSVIIISALANNALGEILRSKAPTFLGEISYSFYLLHMPILMLFASYSSNTANLWVAGPTALGTSMIVSKIMFDYIECRGIELGRRAARWVDIEFRSLLART